MRSYNRIKTRHHYQRGGRSLKMHRETSWTHPGAAASPAAGQTPVKARAQTVGVNPSAGASPVRQAKPGQTLEDKRKAKVDSLELARPKALEIRRATSRPVQPAPPAVVKIMPTAITVRWNGMESEEKLRYNLEQASKTVDGEESTWCLVNTEIQQDTANEGYIAEISGLKVEEKVSLRLVAINSVGESPPSRAIKIKTIDAPKGVSDVSLFDETSTTCRVRWKTPNNLPKVDKTVENEHQINGLRPAETYDVSVQPATAQGDGPASKPIRFSTKTGVPGAPEPPTVTLEGARELGLSICPIEGVQWRVEHDGHSGGKDWVEPSGYQVLADQNGSILVCTIQGLEPGEEYRIRVSAFNKYGSSKPSKTVSARTFGVPNAPDAVYVNEKEVTATSAALSWTWTRTHVPIGEDLENISYNVYYMAKSRKDKVLLGSTDATEYTAKDLPPNETVTFIVHAVNSIGEGPPCVKTATVKTPPGMVEAPGSFNVVRVHADGFEICWLASKPLPHMTKEEAETPMKYMVEYAETDEKSRKKKDYVFVEAPVVNDCSATLSALKPGTIYALRVAAISAYGKGHYTKPLLAPTVGAPEVPQGVEVSDPTANSVRLSWCPSTVYGLPDVQDADPSDPVVYVIELCSDKKTWKESARTEEDSVIIKGLVPDAESLLRVKAVNKQGESAATKPIIIKTRAGIPNAPETITFGAVGPNSLEVLWQSPKPAVGVTAEEHAMLTYVIEVEETELDVLRGVKKAPATPIWKGTYESKTTTVTADKLKAGTLYLVKVIATNNFGYGLPSKPAATYTVGIPLIIVDPRVIQVSVCTGTVAWGEPRVIGRKEPAVDDPIKYTVIVSNEQGEKQYDADVNTQYTIKGLNSSGRYGIKIVPRNNQGSGPASEPIELRTRPGAPPATQSLTAKNSTNCSYCLSWSIPPLVPNIPEDEQDAVSKYLVQIALSDEVDAFLAEKEVLEKKRKKNDPPITVPNFWKTVGETTATEYSVRNLSLGTGYYSRVVAGNKYGWGIPCKPASIRTLGIPSIPNNLRAVDVLISTVVLSWSASTTDGSQFGDPSVKELSEISYLIEVSKDNKNWSDVMSTKTHENINAKLPPNTSCMIRVKAKNAQGVSSPSEVINIKTMSGLPHAPMDVLIRKISGNSATVAWSAPQHVGVDEPGVGVSSFLIEIAEDAKKKSWTEAGKCSEYEYAITNLAPGSKYLVRVSSINDFGLGEASDVLIVNTVGTPSTVTNVAVAEATATTVSLTWKHAKVLGLLGPDPEDPVSYVVEVLVDKAWAEAGRTSEESITLTGLSAAASCSLRVIASNKQGCGPPSKIVSAKTKVGTPNPPQVLSVAAVGTNKVKLIWQAPVKIDGVEADAQAVSYNVELGEPESKKKDAYGWYLAAETKECSVIVEELSFGTVYGARVSATNIHGEGQPCKLVTFSTIGTPESPSDVVISETYPDAVVLSWSAPTVVHGVNQSIPLLDYKTEDDPVRYVLESHLGGDRWDELFTVSDVRATVPGLKQGVSCTFRVKSINNQGASAPAKPVTVVPPSGLPRGVLFGYVGGASPNSVAVVWAESKSERKYPVAGSVGSASGASIDKWTSVVELLDSENKWVSVNASSKKLDNPPAWALDNVPKKDQTDLVWFGVLSSGLANNTRYSFRVMISNSYGTVASRTFDGSTASGVPPVPEFKSVSRRLPTAVDLLFSAGTVNYRLDRSAETGYKIESRAAHQDKWVEVDDSCMRSTNEEGMFEVSLTGLSAGTRYYVRMYAHNKYGVSQASEQTEIETSNGHPSAPVGLGVLDKSDTSIKLGWNPGQITSEQDAKAVISYMAEISNAKTPNSWSFVSLDVVEGTGEYKVISSIHDLCSGGVYNVRLVASNLYGRSVATEPIVIRLYGPPPRPSAPSVDSMINGNSCLVTWKSLGNDYKGVTYRVETDDGDLGPSAWRSVASDSAIKAHDNKNKKGADDMECAISGLEYNKAYRVRVIAINRWGESEPSGSDMIFTEWDRPRVITCSSRFMYLTWTKNTIPGGNGNYRVEYNAVSDNRVMVLPPDKDKASRDEYTRCITMLLPNTEYVMRLLNAAGQTSKDATFTTGPIQQLPPTGLDKSKSLRITWIQPSEPSGDEGEYVFGDDCLGDDVTDFVIQHDSGTNGFVWATIPRKGAAFVPPPGAEAVKMGEIEDMDIKKAKKGMTASCTISDVHPEAMFQIRVLGVSDKYGLGPASQPVYRTPTKYKSSMYKLDI